MRELRSHIQEKMFDKKATAVEDLGKTCVTRSSSLGNITRSCDKIQVNFI